MDNPSEPAGGKLGRKSAACLNVAGTPVRIEILSVLSEPGMDLRDIADATGTPRTTLRHNHQKMTDEGILEETLDNTYRATPLGRAVLSGLEAFESHLQVALELEPFFDCLCPSDLEVELTALSDAMVTAATQADPFAPHRRLTDVILESDEFTGYFNTNPFLIEAHNSMEEERLRDSSLLVTPELATVIESEYGLSPADDGVVRVVQDGPDYGLAIADGSVLLLGLDDNNKPHALVETEADRCRDWARDRIASLRADATEPDNADVVSSPAG